MSLIAISFLAGCASHEIETPPEPVVIVKYIYPDCKAPPRRDVVDYRPAPTWKVTEAGQFCFSAEGYEDWAYNMTETWKGVSQLQLELDYYKQCVKSVAVEEDEDD